MNELVKTENQFSHEIFGNLTTITNQEGDVFFVVKELSTILGFSNSNDLTKRLEEDEILSFSHAESVAILNRSDINSRGIQLLTESGLYSAILGSKKPEAKVFKKWITSEVLPSIRKTGSYSVQLIPSYQIEDPIERAKQWIKEQEEKQLALQKVENLNTVLDNLLDWVSIIKVSQHNKVKEKIFDWRVLKKKSEELGYVLKKAESPRFGYQNLYHINVFKACYPQYNYDLKNK
jgi:prophage antirepressor-like protein